MPAASAAHSGLYRGRAWPERKLSEAAGFRALTPSWPPRFLFEDAEKHGANEAGERVRKSMEDADNMFPELLFLCLWWLPQPGEGLTGRFREGQWSQFPRVVLSTNTGYPSWAGKVHAGCVSDLGSTWEFQRILMASTPLLL